MSISDNEISDEEVIKAMRRTLKDEEKQVKVNSDTVKSYKGIQSLFDIIGEDKEREGLLQTPARFIRSFIELCSGYRTKVHITTFYNWDDIDQIIISKNIDFYSLCEHHLLPFHGVAHVAYIPDKRIIGLSKLSRVVDMFSKRLQVQERLCEQVTGYIHNNVSVKGVACIIEAEHLCMSCRGVKKQNSTMVTSSLKGLFREKTVKDELLGMINGR